MNPKLLLAPLLETTLLVWHFTFLKKKYISSLVKKIMPEMAEQSSQMVHNELY